MTHAKKIDDMTPGSRWMLEHDIGDAEGPFQVLDHPSTSGRYIRWEDGEGDGFISADHYGFDFPPKFRAVAP